MSADKRYQVFVSSTFLDLREERSVVQKAILELGHFPAGMELFPASDSSSWDIIKDVIDESDYYILIVGGKYGSVHPDLDMGFTEMEYDYAYEKKKPVIALLHKNPDQLVREKTDKSDEKWEKLQKFRAKVQPRHNCQYWEGAHELKANSIVSLMQSFKRFPGVGWLRADTVPSGARVEDVLILKEKIASLESQLAVASVQPASGTEELSQGDDWHAFSFDVENRQYQWSDYEVHFTWNEIFSKVAPVLYGEASDAKLRTTLINFFTENTRELFYGDENIPIETRNHSGLSVRVSTEDVDTCIVQFRALGLIVESSRKRSVTDSGKYWALTPYGDHRLNQLRAVRKSAEATPSPEARPVEADGGNLGDSTGKTST